uniref:Uncharacterized protein n=1 Tax=Anguilla anguilla TaxID=7936 RepID=A0A0E9Q3I3_ANGAN
MIQRGVCAFTCIYAYVFLSTPHGRGEWCIIIIAMIIITMIIITKFGSGQEI